MKGTCRFCGHFHRDREMVTTAVTGPLDREDGLIETLDARHCGGEECARLAHAELRDQWRARGFDPDAVQPIPPYRGESAPPAPTVEQLIGQTCDDLKRMLLEKNQQYGNSALDPLRVFSKASTVEQILVRIDDKLSRMKRGRGLDDSEDVVQDLTGYLILLRIAQKMSKT